MTRGVSVIIPTYEAWPILYRTLCTVAHDCRELGEPWELIIVDNESGAEFRASVVAFANAHPEVRFIGRSGLGGKHFQPGAARNIGIDSSRYESLIFLDADCIPSADLIGAYRRWTDKQPDTVFVGHRVFVDTTDIDAAHVAEQRSVLAGLAPVGSASNYGSDIERRLPELLSLEAHPRAYDCMYACNMAVHRDCIGDLRFSSAFDGKWGYEDIELGYRLHLAGRSFRYLPEAFVFHQEGGSLSADEREAGRYDNFVIAGELIEGFVEYRRGIARLRSVPSRDLPCISE
ncbi:glycosyltransferase family 2 protein [Nocardia terpenica]|uniref:Glycosyltransferase n=1 Tax=Nocardia terpenica TaxID=455432 RepID=A0A6G9Z054_9NOCA|nr:glycosyltransferase [Nocardia terpenica]QIS18453.1 glycosyltransferase [Nocardia terpenica]